MTRTRTCASTPDFPHNRFTALKETLDFLGLKPSEWKHVLDFIIKTDNTWLQFFVGDLQVDFMKFVDIDELHLHWEFRKGRTIDCAKYIFDFNELGASIKKRQLKLAKMPSDWSRR